MIKGGLLPPTGIPGAMLRSDGPLFAFEQGSVQHGTGAALVLSALNHFTANAVQFLPGHAGSVDSLWMGPSTGSYLVRSARRTREL